MMYEYTGLVTIVTILVIFVMMFRVGLGRGKYNVKAPKMSGNDEWDKLFRVHANTIEQAVIFIPALWLTAVTAGDTLAAGIGAVWIAGRLIYAVSYQKNPASRAPGMLMTFGSTALLAGISLYHILGGILA